MAWFKNIRGLSCLLLVITYGTFGWLIENNRPDFSQFILEQGQHWQWHEFLEFVNLTEDKAALGIIYLLAGISILAIVMGLIAPITLLTFAFGSGFKSDVGSVISILLWSFAAVFLMRWIVYLSHLLLLLCSAILVKLDLQDNGYSRWQVWTIMTVLCFLGFILGIVGHQLWLTERVVHH